MPARIALLGLAVCIGIAHAELPPGVASRLASAGIPEDAAGVVVRRLADGVTVLAHGAERSLAPASTMKLVTSWIALESLGPAFRGRTEISTRARVERGVLLGDLVVRGLGDVDLDWRAFDRLLELLRHRGIREIRGDVILDRSFFRPARSDVGVPPFDEAPEFRYNVIPDALLLNTNLLQLDLASDEREIHVALATPLDRVAVLADMGLVDAACEDWEKTWKIPTVETTPAGLVRVVLQGAFPRNCRASTAINVIDREVFAGRLFAALWSRRGGVHHGRVRDGVAPAGGEILAQHRSRPLAEVVREVNKDSDNPMARVLYLTLGALAAGTAELPTAERAEAEVRAWFARNGIDSAGLVLENGSGLSRAERLRPSQLAALLEVASRGPWWPEFLASLPIAATDGTMRKRLAGRAAASVRVKTGTLRDASGVAGYVKADDGETYVVAAILNDPAASHEAARPILDELLEWVASRPKRAAAAAN
jgi:D-alanyl-D-alanine carboxypeptidase/D-alanyl-D-alanine-endopeptidase (penicillin-binding protein 4)